VHFTDTDGTVWKPMLFAQLPGTPNSFLKLDFDWRFSGQVDDFDKAFTAVLRGTGNIEVAAVAIGGPGAVAVRQKGLGWVPLHMPLTAQRWGHLTIIADPISRGENGAYSVIVAQDDKRMVFPNIPFCPPGGKYPDAYWYSPCFQLGGGAVAGAEAWLDSVKLEVVAGRRAWER
jgi:hypothetical protein